MTLIDDLSMKSGQGIGQGIDPLGRVETAENVP